MFRRAVEGISCWQVRLASHIHARRDALVFAGTLAAGAFLLFTLLPGFADTAASRSTFSSGPSDSPPPLEDPGTAAAASYHWDVYQQHRAPLVATQCREVLL